MRTTLIIAMIILAAATAGADIYEYTDESGAVNFTDDPAKVPKKFSKKTKTRDGGVPQSVRATTVTVRGNQVVVPVTIVYGAHEVTANLLLDTGATTCTITPELASRLNIQPKNTRRSLTRVVGGEVYEVGTVRLDSVQVGPNRASYVDAAIIDSPYDGLLGMNVLKQFTYRIDYHDAVIRWGE